MEKEKILYRKLPDLIIGNLKINPPIIQGGMGVRISKANLAAAVANEGGVGVIASVGLGDEELCKKDYIKYSDIELRNQIRKARSMTKGYLGVNIMVALTNYENLVKTACEENIDLIISGSGIPMKLPSYVTNPKTKLLPIVSSGRAAEIICKAWGSKYNRLPDALVVEGPLAGGHLGFSMEELNKLEEYSLEKLLQDVLKVVRNYELKFNGKIPVIPAGGIFDGRDIAKLLKLGASGVQIATRFVCTEECDAALELKQAFIKARKEDITIIKSPVGLPGRVIRNKFVEDIEEGRRIKFDCPYKCLKTCDSETAPYCIANALVNASKGDLEHGFAMCGTNAYRVKKIVKVKELMKELTDEAIAEYYRQ